MSYTEFLTMVDQDQVKKVDLNTGDNTLTFTTGEGESEKIYETTMWPGDSTLIERLDEHNVDADANIPDTSGDMWLMLLISYGLPILIFLGIGWWLNRRMKKAMGDDGPSMNFGGGGFGMGGGLGKSNAKEIKGEETGVTFKDVAGQDEAKESLQEIVSFLKNPEKYNEIGARCPRGALLVGPPGTGKTLLAKAVAGEAGVTFFQIAGSAFVEMFVGRGAAKVRDLFKQASEKAPCIVFIDEIDAVGKRRDSSLSSNDEREQTLNQLLSEMDGFDNHKGIVVLAATNRPETLDQALLRPGRFDRRIPVELPDLAGREAILKIHADDVKMERGHRPRRRRALHARRVRRRPRQHHQRGRAARRALRPQPRHAGGPARVRRRGHRRREEEVHRALAAREGGRLLPRDRPRHRGGDAEGLGARLQDHDRAAHLGRARLHHAGRGGRALPHHAPGGQGQDRRALRRARRRGAHLQRDDHRRLQRHREGHAARARHGHAVRHVREVRHGAARPAREPLPRRRLSSSRAPRAPRRRSTPRCSASSRRGTRPRCSTLRENRFKLHEIAHYLQKKETITGEEFMNILTRDDGFAPKMPTPPAE